MRDEEPIYFYELHENDDELYSDVLLANVAEYDDDEFLTLVLEARERVMGAFEEDTLSEAIGRELGRRNGFIVIDDNQLRAAISVSANEGETRVATVEERRATDGEAKGEFRSLLVEADPEDRRWGES